MIELHNHETQYMQITKPNICFMNKLNVVSLPVFASTVTESLVKFPALTLTLKSYFVPGFKSE